MIKGNCLCGTVIVTAEQKDKTFTACHCGMCRRWGGGPFMEVNCDNVKFRGEESISIFDSSKWAERGFCKNCGSHLFYHIKESDEYQIPLGLFGNSIEPKFGLQVFIDCKPANYAFSNETKGLTEAQIFEMYAPKN